MQCVVVVGLGSMGRRRIRILCHYYKDIVIFGMDSSEKRRMDCRGEYGIEIIDSLDQVRVLDPKAVFVCTSPLAHAQITTFCLEHKIPVFSELNLQADGYEHNMALAEANNTVLFLSSTFLYRREIRYIIDQIRTVKQSVRYIYHTGQYLPDWHPWEKLEHFFVSQKDTNGCRELLAIELPWIVAAFGKIEHVRIVRDKISQLPIDYPDSYLLLLEHVTGHKGMIAVDVISREAVRNLEVFGEEIFLRWNGQPDGLVRKNIAQHILEKVDLYKDELVQQHLLYSRNIIENAYVEEVKHFFAVLAGEADIEYSFAQDKVILDLIQQIEMEKSV